MTKLEILQCVAQAHNYVAEMTVSGDNAILAGESLKALRALAKQLQEDLDAEQVEADAEP